MRLTDYEVFMCLEFHNEYFNHLAIRKFKKPDLEGFIEKKGLETKRQRWRLILSIYFFKFWSLAYITKKPSQEFIKHIYSQYKN